MNLVNLGAEPVLLQGGMNLVTTLHQTVVIRIILFTDVLVLVDNGYIRKHMPSEAEGKRRWHMNSE
jgi:hypothetical protein